MLVCNFLAAGKACLQVKNIVYSRVSAKIVKGPTIAVLDTARDFFPTEDPSRSIAWVAYFFTSTALVQVSGQMHFPLVHSPPQLIPVFRR